MAIGGAERNGMNVLVVGGAGYIGSVVTSELVQAGHNVTVYDNLSHGHLAAVHKDARFMKGDISDPEAVRNALTSFNIDAVMHFAALIEAGESMKEPARFFRNNTGGTTVLLDAMSDVGTNLLVFSSTAAVYGDPKRVPIAEKDKLDPTNAYGATKLAIEGELKWLAKLRGLHYAALRYFNACGATETLGEDHHPETHLIPIALRAANNQTGFKLYGTDYPTEDGTCVRDYIHVEDLASAHLLALEALENGKQELVYNVGTGKGFSNRQVIDAVGKVVGKPIQVTEDERRAGDPAILVASSAKITKELGWKPKNTTIEGIVSSAWEWRQKNPEGYKDQ